MCHRVGQEREAERQALIGRFEALPLAEKEAAPREIGLIPKVVAVQADGGRYQQRTWDGDAVLPHADDESHTATEGQAGEPSEDVTFATAAEPAVSACTAPSAAAEPSEPLPEPERKGCWREDKIGVLLKFNSETHEFDPAPRVPEGFLDIIAMGQLAHGTARRTEWRLADRWYISTEKMRLCQSTSPEGSERFRGCCRLGATGRGLSRALVPSISHRRRRNNLNRLVEFRKCG